MGYLDCGGRKVKLPDPARAPFVRLAFTWYATGGYTLRTLGQTLFDMGFRNKAGSRVTMNGLSHGR